MSVSFIHYKGKKILYVDYSNCTTIEQTLEILDEVKELYLKSNESYLSLNNFSGAFGSTKFMNKANLYGKEYFDHRTIKNAGIGITGIKRILLNAYNLVVKNKLMPFNTKEEALEYLSR